jgi:hypothetical protein
MGKREQGNYNGGNGNGSREWEPLGNRSRTIPFPHSLSPSRILGSPVPISPFPVPAVVLSHEQPRALRPGGDKWWLADRRSRFSFGRGLHRRRNDGSQAHVQAPDGPNLDERVHDEGASSSLARLAGRARGEHYLPRARFFISAGHVHGGCRPAVESAARVSTGRRH